MADLPYKASFMKLEMAVVQSFVLAAHIEVSRNCYSSIVFK